MKGIIAGIAFLAISITVIVIAVRVMGWKTTLAISVAISVVGVVVNYILSVLIKILVK